MWANKVFTANKVFAANKKIAAVLAVLAALCVLAGCTGAPPSSPAAASKSPIQWQGPIYPYIRPRIAFEDRYLYLKSDALMQDDVLYCLADELVASVPGVGDLPQSISYEGKEYLPVRAYYQSLGLSVSWDGGLGLVRVYENEPVYSDKPSDKQVNVLLYHHILREDENTQFIGNGSVLSAEAFEAQIKYLSDNGCTAITLMQLYDFLYNNRELPDNSVLITFDDGYYSNMTRAYPILKKYGMTAVIFAITGHVYDARDGEFDPDATQYITLGDMREYSDVFEYASHTHAMHDTNKYGMTLFETADTVTLRSDLERSFITVNNNMALAYPLGMYNESTIGALHDTTIKLAFTTASGPVWSDSDPFRLNRHIIWPSMDIAAFAALLR